MKDSKLAGSQQNENKDTVNVDHLNKLLVDEGDMKGHLQKVQDMITSYDIKIKQTEKKISQQRKSMGGVHMSQAKQVALQKHIRVLENRLDQANRKFNHSLSENKDLRSDIDHMRTERTIFQNLYKKLDKNLNDNKDEIAKVIESSTSAYDARDDAQNKMIALKEKSDKELLQYNTDLKELMRIIDHDRKLKEFMSVKCEDRAEMLGFSLQHALRREERERKNEKEDVIQSYEMAFEQIKDATDIEDLQLLVGKFIETEDKNFALFNYVNELNNEIDHLHEQISDTQNAIERFKQETIDTDEQREDILEKLKEKCTESEKEVDGFNKVQKKSSNLLDEVRSGIESTFKKINCDVSSLVDMLGGDDGVTNANLMQYLGIIEQRTNELLQVQAFLAAKDVDVAPTTTERAESVGLLGRGPLPLPAAISIQPPSTGDDYDSDSSFQSEDENRPLTQQELRQRIMKGINKRENSSRREKEGRNSPDYEPERPKKTSKKSPIKER